MSCKTLTQREFQILADNALDFCDGDAAAAGRHLMATIDKEGWDLPAELPSPGRARPSSRILGIGGP